MGNFSEAYKLTGHNEGGYSFDPADHGGETFAGISRRFWPNWSGWVIIDQIKVSAGATPLAINKSAAINAPLQQSIASFYKQNFWDVNSLDLINDNQLCDNIYDFGVNSGVGEAAMILQRCLGVMVDGKIGNKTVLASNSAQEPTLYNAYNTQRISFYHNLAQNPGQLKFLNSWMSRIKPYKIS